MRNYKRHISAKKGHSIIPTDHAARLLLFFSWKIWEVENDAPHSQKGAHLRWSQIWPVEKMLQKTQLDVTVLNSWARG